MLLEQDVGRSCGACTACCKPFMVPEVGKLDGEWCRYCVQGAGCSIYSERPRPCKLFACLWLNGKGPDTWRPDILGVLMDWEELTVKRQLVCVLHLYEMWDGALASPVIEELIEKNLNNGTVVLLHQYSEISTMRVRSKFFSEIDTQCIFDALLRRAAPVS